MKEEDRLTLGSNMLQYLDPTYLSAPETPTPETSEKSQPALTTAGWHICQDQQFVDSFVSEMGAAKKDIPIPEQFTDFGCLFGAKPIFDETMFSMAECQQDQLLNFMATVKTPVTTLVAMFAK